MVAVFSLPLDTRTGAAEVMGECPRCGAITTQVLELAWRARILTCTECLMSMPGDGETLYALRQQAVQAQGAIDALHAAMPSR